MISGTSGDIDAGVVGSGGHLDGAGGQREHRIAIQRVWHGRMVRASAVMCGDGDAAAAGRAQHGVGGDHRDRGVERAELGVPVGVGGDLVGRRRDQAELLDLIRQPRQSGGRVDRVTGGVDDAPAPRR